MAADKKDHWSSKAYNSAASFVPKLTSTVVSDLDAQATDNILDIGCGDGVLTAQLARAASQGRVLGLDASKSFIASAQETHASPKCEFKLHDCAQIASCSEAATGKWDKVFSNAALHWILRNPATRLSVFSDVHLALKPGGKFVFEMGGKGNVAEIHTAFISELVAQGLGLEAAREACPWFFPSVEWMCTTLTDAGFEVEKCEIEYRPTKCNPESEDGSGGLKGWLRLMGAQFLEPINESKREGALDSLYNLLETVVTREEDGSKWLGYVRLRAVARKM